MARNKSSVLMVDADTTYVEQLAGVLRKFGHKILTTPDSAHAVSILEFRAFDVLMLDVETSLQKGIDLISYASCICPRPRVVVMGSTIPDETERSILNRGANIVFRKPIDVDVLQTFLAGTRSRSSFSGLVEEVDIVEYIQFILLGGKQTVLEVTSSLGTKCMLYLAKGQILHAVCGVLQGEKALYRCLCFKEGKFHHKPWEEPRQVTINQHAEFLLMEGVRQRDEAFNATDETSRIN